MKKILYLFLTVSLIFSSCEKEAILGCTDSQATNYNIEAEDDDNSCLYAGSIVFYLEYDVPELLDDNGVGYLYFDIGNATSNITNLNWNAVPGSISTTWTGFLTSPYDCDGDFKSLALSWQLSSSISESLTWQAKDILGNVYDWGAFSISKNECKKIGVDLVK